MKDKTIIFGLFIILAILIFNMIIAISSTSDYETRKQSGNERWLQVENRILHTEQRVDKLEEELKKWSK